MATPGSGPQWWDREFDDKGKPIRTDVREAGHALWRPLCARVRASLGDVAEAPELMELAVAHISRHLDRSTSSPPPGKAKRLLGLYFSQLLYKRAARLRRLEFVGSTADLDEYAPLRDWDWVTRVNLRLDFEKVRPLLGNAHCTLFTMRRMGHEWEEVGEKLGTAADLVRASFWRAVRRARNVIESRNSKGKGGGNKR